MTRRSGPAVKPIAGMHAITPHRVCPGAADAIAFQAKAFDVVGPMRPAGPCGLVHAAIRIGDSVPMPVDEMPDRGPSDRTR